MSNYTVRKNLNIPENLTVKNFTKCNGKFVNFKELTKENVDFSLGITAVFLIHPSDYALRTAVADFGSVVIILPEPSQSKGRLLKIINRNPTAIDTLLQNSDFMTLDTLVFEDFRTLICDGETWHILPHFI